MALIRRSRKKPDPALEAEGIRDVVRKTDANPQLVYASVTPFGQTGPYARRAGYASIGEAMGGVRHTTGDPDRMAAFGSQLAAHGVSIEELTTDVRDG